MAELVREKIWDPVTRLWHWVLVAAVGSGWYFGEFMTFTSIDWHFYCGYTVLGLVAFRLLWGLVGPRPVRLTALIPTPRALLAYLAHVGRRQPSGSAGHNPLGALSVIAMLVLLTAQATTGLFIGSDDFFESGPLRHLVTEALSNRLNWWHHFMAKALLVVVGLHVCAILFYLGWKRENLVLPMITGWKWVRTDTSAARATHVDPS